MPLKIPKMTKIVSPETGNEFGRGSWPYDVTNRAECLSLWSLSSV